MQCLHKLKAQAHMSSLEATAWEVEWQLFDPVAIVLFQPLQEALSGAICGTMMGNCATATDSSN